MAEHAETWRKIVRAAGDDTRGSINVSGNSKRAAILYVDALMGDMLGDMANNCEGRCLDRWRDQLAELTGTQGGE